MNVIAVNFFQCDPNPSMGYEIWWKKAGTSNPFASAGIFFSSPAIFSVPGDPGDQYNGYIISKCRGEVTGNPVFWYSSVVEESSSGGGGGINIIIVSGYNDASTNEITIVNPSFYSIVSGSFPIVGGGSVEGLHTGYNGVISVNVKIGTSTLFATLRLIINGVLQECITVLGDGFYAFAPVFIVSSDQVMIQFFDDVC